MRRTTVPIVTIAFVVLLSAAPGLAHHCAGEVTAIPLGDETLYVETRENGETGGERYFYLESNDEPGLQRGWEDFFCSEYPQPLHCRVSELLWTDHCLHANPDTLLVGYDGTDT